MHGIEKPFYAIVACAVLLLSPHATAQNPVQKWKTLEADNGVRFGIDLNSITHFDDGSAWAIICMADNGVCPITSMTRLKFDCRGHYLDVDNRGAWQLVPPRSVVGRMAEMACAGARDTRFETPDSPSTPKQKSQASAATKAFGDCLLAEGRAGTYATSGPMFDGGKSVLFLMGQCQAQWDAWQAECIANGGTDGGPGGCATRAYLLAYGALKILGK